MLRTHLNSLSHSIGNIGIENLVLVYFILRAIDVSRDPLAVLDTCGTLGIVRILTSGGASSAVQGMETIKVKKKRNFISQCQRMLLETCGQVQGKCGYHGWCRSY